MHSIVFVQVGHPPLPPSLLCCSPNNLVENLDWNIWRSGRGKKSYGDGGYRSPYLSHAKRALYHLSYVPVGVELEAKRDTYWGEM